MNHTKTAVTIGIAAYNEEQNIGNLIRQIYDQKRGNWELKEILVYCDGCSDSTAQKAREAGGKELSIKENTDQKGKVYRVNELLRDATGEIVVLFDADITLADRDVITHLVAPFLENDTVMLVGARSLPHPPRSIKQNILQTTFRVFDGYRNKIKDGNNTFNCTGACFVLRDAFARTMQYPDILINEDDFVYLTCISRGYAFRCAQNAVVHYQLPGTFRDYIKQIFRSNHAVIPIIFREYFSDLVDTETSVPRLVYLTSFGTEFIKNPVGIIIMTAVHLACRAFIPSVAKKFQLSWYRVSSTK